MELNIYRKIIKETAVYPTEVTNFGYAYTIMGLLGEIGEVYDKILNSKYDENLAASINKEIGGCLWYTAAACDEFKIDFESIVEDALKSTTMNSMDNLMMFNTLKKIYRDGKAVDPSYWAKYITIWLGFVLKGITKSELSVILKNNYDELLRRRVNNTLHGDGDNR